MLLAAVVGERQDGVIQALEAETSLSDRLGVAWRRGLSPGVSEDLLEAGVDGLQVGGRVPLQGCRGQRVKAVSNFPCYGERISSDSHLIHYLHEAQAMRGRRPPGLLAVLGLQDSLQVFRVELASADVQQRPHDDPDHVLQKTVSRDDEVEAIRLLCEARLDHAAHGAGRAVVGRPKGGKIMLADKGRRPLGHGGDVQRIGDVEKNVSLDGRRERCVPDGVPVGLVCGRSTRLKFVRHAFDAAHDDVGRKQAIEGPPPCVEGETLARPEVGHLAQGMDPCVGPPGADDPDLLA